MHKAKGSVRRTVVVAGSELGMGEDIESMGIGKDPLRDDFLKELSVAFEKADRAVGFGKAVIGFIGFWDDNDKSFFPRMVT